MLIIWNDWFPVCARWPVEKVRSQWDGTQHGVEARLLQLDHMTTHSEQWQDQFARVKAMIGQNDARLHNLLQMNREPLTKQISDNKVSSSGHDTQLIRILGHAH